MAFRLLRIFQGEGLLDKPASDEAETSVRTAFPLTYGRVLPPRVREGEDEDWPRPSVGEL